VSEICKNRSDVIAKTFCYMQILPLPFMLNQEMFYLCIKHKAVFNTYTEGTAKRGPNEVCRFLLDYFNTIPEEVKKLHVFMTLVVAKIEI